MKKIVGLLMGFVLLITATVSVSAANYEVQEGDTLWNIASDNDMTVDELVELNALKNTIIKPKQKLSITSTHTYTVKQRDTLYGISKEFDVTVEQLKEWNELNSDIIHKDQTLTIKGGESDKGTTKEASQTKEQAEPKKEAKPEKQVKADKVDGKSLTVTATAYTAKCHGCSGVTATGINLNNDPNAKVIAVDPNVIPLGSKVHVEGYGEAIAGDTGGAIKGNKVDLHVPTKNEALQWGVRTVNVTILD